MNKRVSDDIKRYLDFLGLDENEIDTVKEAWYIIDPHMPQLIEQFYEHLFSTEAKSRFVGKNIEAIKTAQYAYWRELFDGKFEPAYMAHVDGIIDRHHAAGVDLTHYIGAYAWFSERFFRIVARDPTPGRYPRQVMLTAINKLIYLDLMIAAGAAGTNWVDI